MLASASVAAQLRYAGVHDLIDSAEALSGVRAAAVGMQMPTQVAGSRTQVQIVGESRPPAPATLRPVSPRYFEVLGVPLAAGRAFSTLDAATSPTVAMVNARFVRDVLGGRSPIGRRLTASFVKGPLSVVGLVGDITPAGEPDRPALYVPVDQQSVGGGFLMVKTQADARSMLPTLTARVQSLAVDRVLRVSDVLEEAYRRSLARTSFALVMLAIAGRHGVAPRRNRNLWRHCSRGVRRTRRSRDSSAAGVPWRWTR